MTGWQCVESGGPYVESGFSRILQVRLKPDPTYSLEVGWTRTPDSGVTQRAATGASSSVTQISAMMLVCSSKM
jgi:hypothetical protein